MNTFINLTLDKNNIDRFFVRSSIFNALKNSLPFFKGSLIDIGCGGMPYRSYILSESLVDSYIGLDIETALKYNNLVEPDVVWDGNKMPFENNRFQTAFATEVLEHCPEPKIILKEVYRILEFNGIFFFTVPFLWPLHEVPHDEFRYTPFSLERLLSEAGFTKIEIKALGGWNASLAQMLGLWLRRAPMSMQKRRLFTFFLMPIFKLLLKKDKIPVNFEESTMISGLYGYAFKK